MSSPASDQRLLTYVDALREAVAQEMRRDDRVFLFGLDTDDHKGIQGSTQGLLEEFGPERVFGTPLSEDAMTGVAIGAAMAGMRPIHVHIRMDFLMLCMNQLINIAAKSHYMYGGQVAFRQGFEKLQIQGVEFKQLGQGGLLGRYPVHFHMARNVPADTYVIDSSVNESMTRWFVIHSTIGVTLAQRWLQVHRPWLLSGGCDRDGQQTVLEHWHLRACLGGERGE